MAKKWLDSIEKQKRRINLKFVRDRQTDRQTDKPVGDGDSAPSPNVVAMATWVTPQHFAWFH